MENRRRVLAMLAGFQIRSSMARGFAAWVRLFVASRPAVPKPSAAHHNFLNALNFNRTPSLAAQTPTRRHSAGPEQRVLSVGSPALREWLSPRVGTPLSLERSSPRSARMYQGDAEIISPLRVMC